MGSLSVTEAAALSRIAGAIEHHVTNSIIDRVAETFFTRRFEASNKLKKIQMLVAQLAWDKRAKTSASEAVSMLVLEAHQRTLSDRANLTIEDVDAIVKDMRVLGLAPGELAHSRWRKGLKNGVGPEPAGPQTRVQPSPAASTLSWASARPARHDALLRYVGELAMLGTPQHRGYELEKIVTEVAISEHLRGRHNIVNPGEQIDLTFVLEGQHYLAECRWTKEPQGTPAIREFSEKIRRKAEGTFGVLISMGGFVESINSTAAEGSRLNCVGLTSLEIMAVLEGRITFAGAVATARAEASSRNNAFYRWPNHA